MKRIIKYLTIIFILFISFSSVMAIELDEGISIKTDNITWVVKNNIYLDNITIGDKYVMFENDNISIISSTQSLTIDILNWTKTNKLFNITDPSQKINYTITINNKHGYIKYKNKYRFKTFTFDSDLSEFSYAGSIKPTLDPIILEDLSETSARISISSNVESSSTITYYQRGEPLTNLSQSDLNEDFVHSFTLSSLKEGTEYYIEITICDLNNNCSVESRTITTKKPENTIITIPSGGTENIINNTNNITNNVTAPSDVNSTMYSESMNKENIFYVSDNFDKIEDYNNIDGYILFKKNNNVCSIIVTPNIINLNNSNRKKKYVFYNVNAGIQNIDVFVENKNFKPHINIIPNKFSISNKHGRVVSIESIDSSLKEKKNNDLRYEMLISSKDCSKKVTVVFTQSNIKFSILKYKYVITTIGILLILFGLLLLVDGGKR